MLKPFKTSPLLVPKVWGGRRLETSFGKTLPDEQLYGESWEVADLAEGQSTVDGGPDHGATLHEMVKTYGEELTGSDVERYPLLIKLLDAKTDLSVQVHPGKEDLARHPGAFAKDESWIFLETDGQIFHGVVEGTDASSFRAAIEDGSVMALMRAIDIERFDAIRVAPGTIHAIGGGVALLEIQTPSDTTFRVWDHGRMGMDGNPRTLHVDQAMDVAKFVNTESLRSAQTESGVVVETDAYTIHRFVKEGTFASNGRACVATNVGKHAVQISHVVLKPFETAIIPAHFGGTFQASGDLIVAWA